MPRLLEHDAGALAVPLDQKWAGYGAFNAVARRPARAGRSRAACACVGLYGMSEVQALYARQPLKLPVARRKLGGGVPTSPLGHVRVRDPDSGELLGPGQPGALEMRRARR